MVTILNNTVIDNTVPPFEHCRACEGSGHRYRPPIASAAGSVVS